MIKLFSKRDNGKKQIHRLFNLLIPSVLKYLFSFWLLIFFLNLIFFILMQCINLANSEFNARIFLSNIIIIIISASIVILIYIFSKKYSKKFSNLRFIHDLLIIIYCLMISILNIYKSHIENRTFYIFEAFFLDQIFSFSYFIPLMTINSKKIKILTLFLYQFLFVIIEILQNPQGNIQTSKGLILLMCIFIIDVKISGFNQIFLDQIKKSTNAKADEKINWKRVIEQMPNGFILINLKKRKIVFLNDSAMKIFDINDPLKKKESFDVINEKLGVLTLQKIQKEPIKSDDRKK